MSTPVLTRSDLPADATHPRRRYRVTLAMVLLAIGVAVVAMWSVNRTGPRECATARDAIGFVGGNEQLLSPWLIAPSGPALTVYQDWSHRLHGYASDGGNADIAAPLRQIAELSSRAVTIVEQVRRQPISEQDMFAHISAYDAVAHQMADAEHLLVAQCDL